MNAVLIRVPMAEAYGEANRFIRRLSLLLIGILGFLFAVSLTIEAEAVRLGVGKAAPCGLILNELISNALKYAFPGRRNGEIRVGLQSILPEADRLSVADDGIGFPLTLTSEKKAWGCSWF